jgi:hypothetical protein
MQALKEMWKRVEGNTKNFRALQKMADSSAAQRVRVREKHVARELSTLDSPWEVDHFWEHRAVDRKVRLLIDKIDSRPCRRGTCSVKEAAAATAKLKERNEKRARPYSFKHRRQLLESVLARERERHVTEVTQERKEAAIRFRAVMNGGECTFTLEDARMVASKSSSTRTIQQMVEQKINRCAIAQSYSEGESKSTAHEDAYHVDDEHEGTPPQLQGSRKGRRGSVMLRRKTKNDGERHFHLQKGISRKSLWRQSKGISAVAKTFRVYTMVSTEQMMELIVQAMVAKADAQRHFSTPSKSKPPPPSSGKK